MSKPSTEKTISHNRAYQEIKLHYDDMASRLAMHGGKFEIADPALHRTLDRAYYAASAAMNALIDSYVALSTLEALTGKSRLELLSEE